MEKDLIVKLTKKYKKSEKFISLLVKMCKDSNIKNNEKQIEQFLKKWQFSVSKSVSYNEKIKKKTGLNSEL